MILFAITVYGAPAPQGSKRFVGTSKAGRGILVEMSKKVTPWRESVKFEALALRRGAVPLDGPIYVSMVFSFTRPRNHYRTGKNASMLRTGAPTRPSGTPDLSKLARSTEDALTNAGIWRDDARVVEYIRLAKVYVGEDRDALDAPGVKIEIRDDDGIPF